ncbi:MAG: hypothetical protein Q4D02_05735 [Clostridia bacterium]|nr:hypothetical protein [Clostridia bacterium]
MRGLNQKRGVTLTVLAITIVIMVILASTVIINIGDSVTDTKKTTYATDLKTIEDAVSMYYIQNNKMPSDEEALSEQEILNLSGNENMTLLREELSLNGDDHENLNLGSFYKVDLSKIGIEGASKGLGTGNDIYVVSYSSLKVYYLAGLNADGTKYFSLSSKLTGMNPLENVEENDLVGETKVQTVSGVTVKKQVKTWTNEAKILIQANIAPTEKLYLSIAGKEKRGIETTTGNNNLSFGSLEQIKSGKANIKVDITQSDIEYFNSLPQSEKVLYIIKEKNGEMVANVKVDMANFENQPPVISNINEFANENTNIVEFTATDSISGLKSVYYEYLEYYNGDGEIKSYYTDVYEYDIAYMKTRGKKVNITGNETYQISIPKNITKIQITALDNAGNATTIKKELSKEIYATILSHSISNKTLNFDILILTLKDINHITTYVSTNGIDFEDEKNIENVMIEDGKIIQNVVYENIEKTTQDIYVKIVVVTNTGEEYVRMINLNDIENKVIS